MSLHCSWRDMMREATERLAAAGVEGPARDARLLLAHALAIEPLDVILRETDQVDPAGLTAFEAAIHRRLMGEPVSRIRGWRDFYGHRFIVTPDVLDPRPETELLVSEGLKRLPRDGRILDLGAGSGCIILSLLSERADVTGVGVDISPAALAVARANAKPLGVAHRATLIAGGWDAPKETFDLILSNPPYIGEAELAGLDRDVLAHDPHVALTPGPDALAAYRAILSAMPALLKPGGWIGFELGAGQADDVADMMRMAGLEDVVIHPDLAGIGRAAFGRRTVR